MKTSKQDFFPNTSIFAFYNAVTSCQFHVSIFHKTRKLHFGPFRLQTPEHFFIQKNPTLSLFYDTLTSYKKSENSYEQFRRKNWDEQTNTWWTKNGLWVNLRHETQDQRNPKLLAYIDFIYSTTKSK